jgi:putative membrane protein
MLAVACCAALSAGACGGADRDEERAANPAATGGVMSESPQEWVQKAIEKNTAEIQLGELAAERAQNPQVKQFARTMVEAHNEVLGELKQLAARENIPVADGANDEHRELHTRLSKLSGAEFDREYLDAMVEAHDDTLEMLDDKADDLDGNRATGTSGTGDRPADSTEAQRDRINHDLAQWAAKTAPNVRQHLEKAKQLKEQLDQ